MIYTYLYYIKPYLIIHASIFYLFISTLFRLMIEECDRLTGVNVFADLDGGFGGLSVQCLQYLRDEVRGAVLVSNIKHVLSNMYIF